MDNDYFITEDEGEGRCLVLRAPWSQKFVVVIQQEGIKSLRLSRSAGWEGDSISFLDDVPQSITGVEVYNWDVTDLSPLYGRQMVEHLGFEVNLKQSLDLRPLRGLRSLFYKHTKKIEGLYECDLLEHLNISSYPDVTLEPLCNMKGLSRLQVFSRKLQGVAGVAALPNLSMLELSLCSNLTSLEGLEQVLGLVKLELYGCKKVMLWPDLSSLYNLRSLKIENCGSLASIGFLRRNQGLEEVLIIGSTQIADGDLSPLVSLPRLKNVRVAQGKYNLSPNQIEQMRSV